MALTAFLKQNREEVKNVKFVASERFKDENGNPIKWEIRPLHAKEAEAIRTACRKYEKGGKVSVDNGKFNRMVAAKSTVFPNLNDAELQDSYNVMCAEDLIVEMLDMDSEFIGYVQKCSEVNGWKEDKDLVEEAKNS